MKHTRLLTSALAVAAVGAGISACASASPPAGHRPAGPAPASVDAATGMGAGMPSGAGAATASYSGVGSAGFSTGPGAYILGAMPTGTVSLERGTQGRLHAHVDMFGLTPGSSHNLTIDGPGRAGPVVSFPAVTASSGGQIDTTVTSAGRAGALPPLSRFVIREGSYTGQPGGDSLAAEPIAESGLLPLRVRSGVFAFHPVTVGPNGVVTGQPAGRATITYDAAAQTLTVNVTAYGLNPGPHAAHIHLGSCQNQGAVKYMLADFTADTSGDVIDQTRVVTGVTSVPGPGNWYLNLHQGGMNQILANGAPTLSFRPMLCANITSFATSGARSAVPSPTAPASTPASMAAMPSATATGTARASTVPSGTSPGRPAPGSPAPASSAPSPSTTPTSIPSDQPTHW